MITCRAANSIIKNCIFCQSLAGKKSFHLSLMEKKSRILYTYFGKEREFHLYLSGKNISLVNLSLGKNCRFHQSVINSNNC